MNILYLISSLLFTCSIVIQAMNIIMINKETKILEKKIKKLEEEIG